MENRIFEVNWFLAHWRDLQECRAETAEAAFNYYADDDRRHCREPDRLALADLHRMANEFFKAIPDVQNHKKNMAASLWEENLREFSEGAAQKLLQELDEDAQGSVGLEQFLRRFGDIVEPLTGSDAMGFSRSHSRYTGASGATHSVHAGRRSGMQDSTRQLSARGSVDSDRSSDSNGHSGEIAPELIQAAMAGGDAFDGDEVDPATAAARAARMALRQSINLSSDKVRRDGQMDLSSVAVDHLNAPPDMESLLLQHSEARYNLLQACTKYCMGLYYLLYREGVHEELRECLRTDGARRSQAQMDKLLELVKDVPFFVDLRLSESVWTRVIRCLKLVELDPGQTLFNKGDTDGGMFIVISGSLQAFLEGSYFGNAHVVSQMVEGNAFGWLSLTSDTPRSTTVKALQASTLAYLDRTSYDDVITSFLEEKHEERLRVIENVEEFATASPRVLDRLCRTAEFVQTTPNEVVIQQGDDAQHVYIVQRGSFKVLQEVLYEHIFPQARSHESDRSTKLPREHPTSVFMQVNELGPYTLFGEVGVMLECARTASVLSQDRGELLRIKKTEFLRYVPKPLLRELYIRAESRYPDETELRMMLKEDAKWDQYKRKLVKARRAQ